MLGQSVDDTLSRIELGEDVEALIQQHLEDSMRLQEERDRRQQQEEEAAAAAAAAGSEGSSGTSRWTPLARLRGKAAPPSATAPASTPGGKGADFSSETEGAAASARLPTAGQPTALGRHVISPFVC